MDKNRLKKSELLLKHGRHMPKCAFFDGKPECDCGFLRVFAVASGVVEGSEDERRLLGAAGETQD